MTSLTVHAPAKINLLLRILERRADGRHNLETVFQKISLADTLTFEIAEVDALTVADSPWPIGPTESNLAWRAMQAVRSHTEGALPPVHITLQKRIPAGAGLGGGSSDAAATLKGLNELCGLGLSEEDLLRIGATLGADVPFLTSSMSCAIGRGIGDELEPVDHASQWPCSVVFPGVGSATAEVYQAWDTSNCKSSQCGVDDLITGLRNGDIEAVQRVIHNDFTSILLDVCPAVERAMKWQKSLGFRCVWPTGSGSAVIALESEIDPRMIDKPPKGFHCTVASFLRREPMG